MRYKLTLLLLALNAALLGYLYYLDKSQPTLSLQSDMDRIILPADFLQGLSQIQIQSKAQDSTWVLDRSPDSNDWSVSSPLQWRANPFAVQQLLFQLRRLSWESRFRTSELKASGQSLASYNLQDPPVRITLQSTGQSLSLALGAPTEIGNRLYLKSPNSDFIYVVSRDLLVSLSRDLTAFLDNRIFTLSSEETRAFQIQDRTTGNARVRLEQRGSLWRFVSPIETAADPDRVEAFLADWEEQQIESFEPGGEVAAATSGDSLRLTFEGLSKRETLHITPPPGEDDPLYYVARRDTYGAVFRLPADLVENLREVQEELRERRVLATEETWTSLNVEFGSVGLTLQQLETGIWQVLFTDSEGQLRTMPASKKMVENLITSLRDLEAQRFVTDAPSTADLHRFALDEPQRRMTVRSNASRIIEFRVGGLSKDSDETLLYAQTNQSDSVFLVRPHILSLLSLDPFSFRERLIRQLPESASIDRITLTHRPSGLQVNLEPGQEGGNEVTPPGVTDALRAFLREMRVEKFEATPFSDPLLLPRAGTIEWPYLLSADINFTSGAEPTQKTRQLFLSKRLGGSRQLVGDPESGLVGTLPTALIEALDPVLAEFPIPEDIPESVLPESVPSP